MLLSESHNQAGESITALEKHVIEKAPVMFSVSSDGAFFSVQGEGASMGFPAVFLRLQTCNLHCHWCDTSYSLNPKGSGAFQWTVSETRDALKQLWSCPEDSGSKRLVITGGEPLLQQRAIEDLLTSFHDWVIEIETNGTLYPTDVLTAICHFNCSPKLSSSGIPREIRLKPNVLRAIHAASSLFKFVVANTEDVEEVDRDIVRPCNLDPKKVILQPLGTTAAELAAVGRNVVEEALRRGYRFLGRLHVDLWGNERRK